MEPKTVGVALFHHIYLALAVRKYNIHLSLCSGFIIWDEFTLLASDTFLKPVIE